MLKCCFVAASLFSVDLFAKAQTLGNYNQMSQSQPDTILVTFESKLRVSDTVNWDDVFIYYPYNSKTSQPDFSDAIGLKLFQPKQAPRQYINAKKEYVYVLILNPSVPQPGAGARIAINPYGPAGGDKWVSSQLMLSVVGGSVESMPIGQTPYRYPVSNNNGYSLLWAPLKENACPAKTLWEYMPQCFSSIVFETYSPLEIQASVYSQTGVVVWSGKWTYGHCNEFQKTNYQSQFGWLAWPLTDRNQNFVESGVYIWRVVYSDAQGKQWVQFHRQGVTGLSADQKAVCRSALSENHLQ